MARLQVLPLPGALDEPPPFALVIDKVQADQWPEFDQRRGDLAAVLGARVVLIFSREIEVS